MKLRNKRTGQEGNFIINKDHFECTDLEYVPEYRSLAELNAEWKDYKPAEPLIKDEKIRKAVRAWAEANAVKKAEFEYVEGRGSYLKDYFCEVQIEFYDDLELTNRKTYTIAELCGEEDE